MVAAGRAGRLQSCLVGQLVAFCDSIHPIHLWPPPGHYEHTGYKLSVIYTTLCPPETFIRDLELIEASRDFDNHPAGRNLGSLYRRRLRRLITSENIFLGEF